MILRAHDVIHSFFVPAMRFKQDAVPGLAIHMHFTPTETGRLRDRLRRTVRARPLQDAWHVESRQPGRIRSNGWRLGRRRNNKWLLRNPTQHAAPQGFIRKYVFSLDHKVIGLQYYFLALTAVFVGMFLSLLMRIHLVWPTACPASARRDQAGNLSEPAHHARHHHGVFRADHGAAGRLRQLFSAHSNRRARHGFSRPEHAVVLDDLRRLHRDAGCFLCGRWRASARLDRLSHR